MDLIERLPSNYTVHNGIRPETLGHVYGYFSISNSYCHIIRIGSAWHLIVNISLGDNYNVYESTCASNTLYVAKIELSYRHIIIKENRIYKWHKMLWALHEFKDTYGVPDEICRIIRGYCLSMFI